MPDSSASQPVNLEPTDNSVGHTNGRLWLRLLGLGLLIGLLGVLAALIINKQAIHDWWRLRGYQPPSAIQRLADQITMTDEAKHLFYLNQPQLLSSVESFREQCPNSQEHVVLGCYHSNQGGIYIYNVKSPDLQGISQVTAAHEDLHAAYDRLSDKDRKYVDGLLRDYYDHGLQDERVKNVIDLYRKTEPNDLLNEMHSIFGTEIAQLPAPLEAYYKRYFKSRAAVVAYQKRYEQAFTARQQVLQADDRQLAAMKTQIDARQAQLVVRLAQLQAAKSQLDNLLAAGQNGAYNAGISDYNTQVNNYNAELASLRAYIENYNDLVTARNAVAEELEALNQAQDTRLRPEAVPESAPVAN